MGGFPPTPETTIRRAGGTSEKNLNLLINVESIDYGTSRLRRRGDSGFGTHLEIYNYDSSTWGVAENNENGHSVNPKSRRKEDV